MGGDGLAYTGLSDPGYKQVAGYFEHGNEHSEFILFGVE
jgi:hypothetical protein